MAKYCFFFFLHLLLFLCNSGRSSHIHHAENTQDFEKSHLDREKQQLFPSIHRALIEYFNLKLTEFDSIDPPTTALPSAPVTSPPITTSPGIITVPGTSVLPPPVPTPTNPPVTNPPVTNPVTPTVPVTNPVTTPSTTPNTGGTTPSTGSGGKSWCIAKNGASQAALQSALDYACGIGGADCVTIQQGSSCYEPATLQNHASYAFNSYYQKNPVATSCDFGGVAAVTTTNPSIGSCVYPSSSSSSSSTPTSTPNNPTTTTPITPTTTPNNPTSFPTPTTSTPGSTFPGTQISPPPGFSIGNPDPTGLGNLGASPPLVNSASVRNLSGSLVIVVFAIMFGL